jgi:hypothetical protein
LLLLRSEFFLWGILTALVMIIAFAASFFGWIDLIVAAAIMSLAVVVTIVRWARYFLTYMVIDVYAGEGKGSVRVERLIPSPNLPESVEMSLQDAAEGVAEVNTLGIFNTLITVLRFGWLRALSIGDLKLRPKTGVAVLEMFNIQDPEGVRNRIQAYWKIIGGARAERARREEAEEQIRRLTVAVAQGVRWAQDDEFTRYFLTREGPEVPKPMPYSDAPPDPPVPATGQSPTSPPPAPPPAPQPPPSGPTSSGPQEPPMISPPGGQNGTTPH